MNLLMISGDRSLLQGKKGPFFHTLEHLRHRFERIDILCPSVKSKPHDQKMSVKIFENVHAHACPRGRWYQPWWIASYGANLRRLYRYGVMTVHEYPPFYNGLGAYLLHRRTGIPALMEIHHIVGDPTPASWTERFGWILSRILLPLDLRWATEVRTVNKTVAARLTQFGVRKDRIVVAPSFYLFRDDFTPFWQHPRKRYDACFCGRLVRNKGLDTALKAVANVPGCTLLVIGDGPLRSTYEKQSESLGIRHRVEFTGWLPTQDDVLRAMCGARMFLMTSRSEGGPRVSLEAMACGLPVIATNVGVMPDVIVHGRNGLLTDGTVSDLSKKIAELRSDPERVNAMGERAKDILMHFEGEKLIAGYAALLMKVAHSSLPKP